MSVLNNTVTRIQGTVITVKPDQRIIEARIKDGMVSAVVLEAGPVFRWPKEGEIWMFYRQGYSWYLGGQIERGEQALPIENLGPDEMKLNASTIYNANGEILGEGGGGSPTGPAGGDLTGTYPDPTIANGAVTNNKIADGAVTNDKITDGSIAGATKLIDNSVTGDKIQNDAVTSAKIADGTIVNADVNGSAAIAQSKLNLDAKLASISALSPVADRFIYFTGVDTAALSVVSSFSRDCLSTVSAFGWRSLLGLGSLAVLSAINNDNWSGTDLSVANGGTGASDATTARTNLGLGSLAVLSAINNGNWSGTDLAVVNGGTGASDAATARSNLGAAPTASPAFTGTPTAPTASPGTNTTQIATTAFVQAASGGGGNTITTYAPSATTSDPSTASTADPMTVVIPEMTVTQDFGGDRLLINFSATFLHSNGTAGNRLIRVALYDGTSEITNSRRSIRLDTASTVYSLAIPSFFYQPASGSRTISVRWNTIATGASSQSTNRNFTIMRIT